VAVIVSKPKFPVERPVLDRFADVGGVALFWNAGDDQSGIAPARSAAIATVGDGGRQDFLSVSRPDLRPEVDQMGRT